MFQAFPLPIIKSFPLYIWHWYTSCRFDDSRMYSGKTPDDGQRNCPKHVEFLDKNKFGKLVRLLVLLKRNLLRCTVTCHDARSHVTMHGHMNVKKIVQCMCACLSLCISPRVTAWMAGIGKERHVSCWFSRFHPCLLLSSLLVGFRSLRSLP
jgi:hypothetical protein